MVRQLISHIGHEPECWTLKYRDPAMREGRIWPRSIGALPVAILLPLKGNSCLERQWRF